MAYLDKPNVAPVQILPWEKVGQTFPPGFTVEDLVRYRRRPAPYRPSDHFFTGVGVLNDETEYKRSYPAEPQMKIEKKVLGKRKNVRNDLALPKPTSYQHQHSTSCSCPPEPKPDSTKPLEPDKTNEPTKKEPAENKTNTESENKSTTQAHAQEAETKTQVPTMKKKEYEQKQNKSNDVKKNDEERYEPNTFQQLLVMKEKERNLVSPGPAELQMHRPRSQQERKRDQVRKTENSEQFVVFLEAKRAELFRRPTSLTIEGEFLVRESENHMKYKAYKNARRPELIRRSTSLKLGGYLDTTTTNKEVLVPHPATGRRHSKRVPTVLKVEGNIEKATENRSKFVEYPVIERPKPLRRKSLLRLHDDLQLSQVTYPAIERRSAMRPVDNLKREGSVERITEMKAKYTENIYPAADVSNARMEGLFTEMQMEMNSRMPKKYSGEKRHAARDGSKWNEDNLESDVMGKVQHMKLEGPKAISKAYQETFVDIKKRLGKKDEVKKISDASNQNGIRKRSTSRKESVHKSQSESKIVAPKKLSVAHRPPFLEFPRERPVLRRSPCRPPEKSHSIELKPGEELSEYHNTYRSEIKRGNSVQLNEFPEATHKKKLIVDFSINDLGTGRRRRRKSRMGLAPSKADQNETVDLLSQTRPVDADESRFNAFEIIDKENDGGSQKVLNTKLRTRSPSPSYRLLVSHVDNQDNNKRVSRSRLRMRSPSPLRNVTGSADSMSALPPPSRQRTPSPVSNKPSFLVLEQNNKNINESRSTSRNNFLDIPKENGQTYMSKEANNWMQPPWYENPSST